MSDPPSDLGLFVVDLRGLDLSREAAESIEEAIQRAALAELARFDLTGATVSFPTRDGPEASFVIGPATMGIAPVFVW